MKFMTLYKHDRKRSMLYATTNTEESMTQKADKDDSDINVIVGRFMKTGQLPQIQASAISGDFTNVDDFRTSLDKLRAAQQAFGELPATIRKKFDNDPAQFIEYASNRDNQDELIRMGLAPPPTPKAPPMEVRVIADPPVTP